MDGQPTAKSGKDKQLSLFIVHCSLFICHCSEIAQYPFGIDRLLRLAMTNDK
jgi:hypothetical protein